MRFKEYRVKPDAANRARVLGLYGDTAKRLARMARRSAAFTHPLGNRRFNDFILLVDEDQVVWVEKIWEAS